MITKIIKVDVGSKFSKLLTTIQIYHNKWRKDNGGATQTIKRNLSAHWESADQIYSKNEAALIGLRERYLRIKKESEQLLSKPRPRDVRKRVNA